MPRIINQDVISQIAELAGKGYSKAAAGRELKLDRATVRKYWSGEKEESKVAEVPAASGKQRLGNPRAKKAGTAGS